MNVKKGAGFTVHLTYNEDPFQCWVVFDEITNINEFPVVISGYWEVSWSDDYEELPVNKTITYNDYKTGSGKVSICRVNNTLDDMAEENLHIKSKSGYTAKLNGITKINFKSLFYQKLLSKRGLYA